MKKKFSIWISPGSEVYQEFEALIQKYAKQHNTPVFPPHITLLGIVESTDEQVIKTVEQVAREIQPFVAEIGDIELSTTYFQCVFARIKTSAELLETYLALKTAFDVEEEHVFMPHMSLVYGDLDIKTREKIAREIVLSKKSFEVDKIFIIQVDSLEPKGWKVFEEVPL